MLEFLQGHKHPEKCAVRVNGVATQWYQDDVKSFAASASSTIVVPKVENPQTILDLIQLLDGMTEKDYRIW